MADSELVAAKASRKTVFISYSHNDIKWVERELLPRLAGWGVHVLRDLDTFRPGSSLVDEISSAIAACDHVLFVVTGSFRSSEWTKRELQQALLKDPAALRRKSIPLVLETQAVPEEFAFITWCNVADQRDARRAWGQLQRELQSDSPDNSEPKRAAAKTRSGPTRRSVVLTLGASAVLLGGGWSLRNPLSSRKEQVPEGVEADRLATIAELRAMKLALAIQLRDNLLSRFRDSGWIRTDPNWDGIDPWAQTQALAALAAGPRLLPGGAVEKLRSALAALFASPLEKGWRSDMRTYFHPEAPIMAMLAVCCAPLKEIPLDPSGSRIVGGMLDHFRKDGLWYEDRESISVPSSYATSLALLMTAQCAKTQNDPASSIKDQMSRAASWLSSNSQTGFMWKPDSLASAPSLGVTLLTIFALMRAEHIWSIASGAIDFRQAVVSVFRENRHAFYEFGSQDGYTFSPSTPVASPFSHTVRFLRNPWAMACADEWSRRYLDSSTSEEFAIVTSTWKDLLSAATRIKMQAAPCWQIAEHLFAINLCEAVD